MADFYGTAAGFIAYTAARQLAYSTDDDNSDIEAALLVASEWIDGKFRNSFAGVKVGFRAQAREWPRTGAVDNLGYQILQTEIPIEVENATYEIAWRQLNGVALNVDFTQAKSYKSVTVDGAISVTYAGATSSGDAQPVFAVIGDILAPLLSDYSSGAFSSLSGSVSRV